MPYLGGSFAPPLPEEKLAEYKALAATAEPQIKEIMENLCAMMRAYREHPESDADGKPHPVGLGFVVPLKPDVVDAIWDHVPWNYECDAIQGVLDTLPADSPLRTPAFHLLWFAKELTRDRVPITNDKL